IAPEGLRASGQSYEPDTGVLVTELQTDAARIRITDALLLRTGADLAEGVDAGRAELLRRVEVLHGRARLRVELAPLGGARAELRGETLRLHLAERPDLDVSLWASVPAACRPAAVLDVGEGDRIDLLLRWGSPIRRARACTCDELLRETIAAWRRWAGRIAYDGPRRDLVRRSAITLKLLDYFATGAIVAAPTSSLPERIGGERNWDYRYTWVRDAAFTVYALNRIGLEREALPFLAWVLDAIESAGTPRILYDLDARPPPPERLDPELRGYRRSRPVRWGNAAADQVQHDVYGELVDCAYQWHRRSGTVDPFLWERLARLVERAAERWRTPDHGIWEVRTPGRPFTYSAAMCQVALDRGARMAEALGRVAEADGWRARADAIRVAILEEAWDPAQQALTEHLGGGGLDASALALPLRRVLPADHPRMIATTDAVARRLGAGKGLLYRYLPHESPDGLSGHEGAFLLCSFWLVEVLALQGRRDEAEDLFEALCGRANAIGLLPEEVDPATGTFLGNFPQALSHVGVISSGVRLARLRAAERDQARKSTTVFTSPASGR
ncbi:MAG TPA: glycoside hydrolase family 15 protein, partial [Anaeromyxobacteraceae bacterium]|nr:glycoside hydrolase family 15 protein [Anaeromyxobacteraceae bacterium]